jgi:hypothetical protein
MTLELKNRIHNLSDDQALRLFWFIFGWLNNEATFTTACESWFKNHGMAPKETQ